MCSSVATRETQGCGTGGTIPRSDSPDPGLKRLRRVRTGLGQGSSNIGRDSGWKCRTIGRIGKAPAAGPGQFGPTRGGSEEISVGSGGSTCFIPKSARCNGPNVHSYVKKQRARYIRKW
jgi:hypothetical protein